LFLSYRAEYLNFEAEEQEYNINFIKTYEKQKKNLSFKNVSEETDF